MEPVERTLLVLYAPDGPLLLTPISQRLVAAGLHIIVSDRMDREELDEAGIELDETAGEDECEQRSGEVGEDMRDCVLVLEGCGAANELKQLVGQLRGHQDSLASLYPALRLHASPSASAAGMSIEALFPALDDTPASLNIPTSVHPLSNAAHSPPVTVHEAQLSPSVQRALERVEADEQAQDDARDFKFTTAEEEELVYDAMYGEGAIDEDVNYEDGSEPDEPSPIVRRVRTESVSTTASTTSSFQARPIPTSHFTAASPRINRTTALRLGLPLPPPRTPTSPALSSSSQPRVIATPKSLSTPSITPRGTKASLLRGNGGLAPLPTASTPRTALSTAERSSAHNIYVDSPGNTRRISIASTASPRIAVRMNKGSSLRAGLEVAESPREVRRRESSVSSSISEVSSGGSRRDSTGGIRSTASPRIVPRGTRTSSLRGSTAGLLPPSSAPLVRQDSGSSDLSSLQEDTVPKRRETISVESTKRPAIEPRLTRTAMLRLGNGGDVKMGAQERRRSTALSGAVPTQDLPPPKRCESISVLSSRPPSITPRMNRSILLRQGIDSPSMTPRASISSSPLPRAPLTPSSRASLVAKDMESIVRVVKAPTIAPRMNRSVELRAAKAAGPHTEVGLMGVKMKVVNRS